MQVRVDIHLSPYTRHIIAVNGASSSPNITALCCSNAGAGKFFVSASATILLVLYFTSLMVWSLTSWSTKCSPYQCVAILFGYLGLTGFSVIAITVCESSYRYEGQSWGKPNSRMMIRTYRSSFPTSLEAYHSHSDVLRDTAEIHSSVVVAIN